MVCARRRLIFEFIWGRAQDRGVEYKPSLDGISIIGEFMRLLGVGWNSCSPASTKLSSPNTAASSILERLRESSRPLILGERGSTLSSGKKSEVGDKAASVVSSQRIQSSKVPKSNAWPVDDLRLVFWNDSSLGSIYEGLEKIGLDEVGDGRMESQESELLTSAGSLSQVNGEVLC